MSEKNAEKKQNNPKLIIAAVCVGIVIIALLVVIILLMSDKGNQQSLSSENNAALSEESKPKREVLVKEDNVDQLVSELLEEKKEEKKKVVPGYYEVTMNSTWEFENGSAVSANAYVKNSESNTTPVYFDIVRSDTNETIYESPVLTVGTDINQIKLDTELPAGTYDCVCVYYLLDEDHEPVSTVRVAVKIKIMN